MVTTWCKFRRAKVLPEISRDSIRPSIRLADSSPGSLPGEWLFLLENQEAPVHKIAKGPYRKQSVSTDIPTSPRQPRAPALWTCIWAPAQQGWTLSQEPCGTVVTTCLPQERTHPIFLAETVGSLPLSHSFTPRKRRLEGLNMQRLQLSYPQSA